jgi:hypothetical protein
MPIELFSSPDAMHVRQSFISPTVYLDHWALRLFSDDLVLQNRLVSALLQKKGTLLLSNISLAEFAKPSDRQHCIAAEVFIERILPQIYFTDWAMDMLQAQEEIESDNSKRFWPSADLSILKDFVERTQDRTLGLSMRDFITREHDNHPQLAPTVFQTVCQIKSGIETFRRDPQYVLEARNSQPNIKRGRIQIIMAELMREFILNPNLQITDNDVVDLLHAMMSVNRCDYVLLDGAWASRAAKLRQRITNASTFLPLARCYSRRNNGVLKFLSDIESFEVTTNSAQAHRAAG